MNKAQEKYMKETHKIPVIYDDEHYSGLQLDYIRWLEANATSEHPRRSNIFKVRNKKIGFGELIRIIEIFTDYVDINADRFNKIEREMIIDIETQIEKVRVNV